MNAKWDFQSEWRLALLLPLPFYSPPMCVCVCVWRLRPNWVADVLLVSHSHDMLDILINEMLALCDI